MSYLFFYLLLATFSFPSQSTDLQKLSLEPQWLRLLHYRNPSRSEVKKEDFFVTKNPKASSLQELQALIQILETKNSPIDENHPKCRFPARTRFLMEKYFKQENVDFTGCKKLQEFIDRTAIESVSVVFSSYYLHNPSSAFGHTLLKINRKTSDDDLMNYGINFAATVDTDNALIYAFKGIFGLFKGEFTAVPYYYKIREYNDYESRDLWSYQLHLTEEEKRTLIYHVWELGNLWAPYYYLDENCSYWILRIIEAASPRLELLAELPRTHVLPIDTIRALFKVDDLVSGFYLRPSLRKKVSERFSHLTKQEVSLVKKSVDTEEFSPLQSKKQLDAALDYFDYKNAKMAADNEPLFEKKKRPLLISRSKISEGPDNLSFSGEIPPHQFHPSSVVSTAVGVQDNQQPFVTFRWKPALHDLVDPHGGFSSSSEINFFDSEFSLYQKQNDDWNFKLRKLDLVRVSVLTPMDNIDHRVAWKFQTGVHQLSQKMSNRHSSLYFSISPGLSFSLSPSSKESLFYFLLYSEVDQQASLENDFLVRMGPQVGTIVTLTDVFKVSLDFKYVFDNALTSQWTEIALTHVQAQYYFSSLDMAVLVDFENWSRYYEYSVGFKYYF